MKWSHFCIVLVLTWTVFVPISGQDDDGDEEATSSTAAASDDDSDSEAPAASAAPSSAMGALGSMDASGPPTLNSVIDFLLRTMATLGNEVQPLRINDTVNTFTTKKFLGLRLYGDAGLINASIVSGLETPYRIDDASIYSKMNTSKLERVIQFKFGLRNIQLDAHFALKFMGYGPQVHFQKKTECVTIQVTLSIISDKDGDSESAIVKFSEVKIIDLAPFEYVVQGFWIFNFGIEILATIAFKIFKAMIISRIEGEMCVIMNKALNDMLDSDMKEVLTSLFKSF